MVARSLFVELRGDQSCTTQTGHLALPGGGNAPGIYECSSTIIISIRPDYPFDIAPDPNPHPNIKATMVAFLTEIPIGGIYLASPTARVINPSRLACPPVYSSPTNDAYPRQETYRKLQNGARFTSRWPTASILTACKNMGIVSIGYFRAASAGSSLHAR